MLRFHHLCIIFLTAIILSGTFSTAAAVGQERSVTIDTGKTGEPISKYIYGQFIEHLGRCIYGGIWAQMLEDRKFYFPITDEYQPYQQRRGRGNRPRQQSPYPVIAASPWQIIGEAGSITMVEEDPFVGEHTPLIQPGSGIRQLDLGLVKNKQYDGYIYLKAQKQPANVTVSLVWGDNPQDQALVQLSATNQYEKSPFKFTSGADTKSGKLEIKVADGACFVGTVSLMPADNIKGMRADTIKLLKELNAPVYRWPGGNFVSGYNWHDGINPNRDKRPPRTNPAWTGVEHNDFGIHEYIEFCKTVGAEPMISVNTGLGTVEQTAEEVEYANGSIDTELGKLRAQNGSAEPFNVKFWCVGNEMYGNWQLGNMPLEQYVLKHNDCANAMKKADPSIKLIAVGNVGRWDEMMMEKCADHMDLISEHFYCQERPDLLSHIAWPSEHIKRISDAHRKYRKEISSLKDKDIRIAMDEWNFWYGPHIFGELGTRYFLKDALGIAKGLHEYYRNSDIIYMANYAQTVNVIGCIKTSKTAAAFETTGLVLKLYGNNYGTVPIEVTNEAEPLDVSAAWTTDRKALTISVVNPTEQEQTITMDLKGAQLAGTGKLGLIANSDPQAYNDPDEEPKVVIEEKQLSNVTNTLTVPALSASLYTLPVR
jgi:alpha-N-arabinofuranosidase